MLSSRDTCVLIRDTTLREGLDTPHVAFSTKEKHRIIQALIEAAVPEIEEIIDEVSGKPLQKMDQQGKPAADPQAGTAPESSGHEQQQ